MKLSKSLYLPYFIWAAIPLVATVSGGAVFHEFVVHAITTNLVLNGIIIGTAAIGALLMLGRIAAIVREWKAFHAFTAWPHTELLSAKWFKKTFSSGLLSHLVRLEGAPVTSRLEQSHIQEELDELHRNLEAKQEISQYLVGLMIALGLLGTFIGLLETLVKVGQLIGGFAVTGGANLDESFTKLIGNLEQPLAAMGTAFSASMFGLIGSLVLGMMLLSVRASQARFLQYARVTVSAVAAHSASKEAGSTGAAALFPEQWFAEIAEWQRQITSALDLQVTLSQGNERRLHAVLKTAASAFQSLAAQENTGLQILDHMSAIPALLAATQQIEKRGELYGLRLDKISSQLATGGREALAGIRSLGNETGQHITHLQAAQERMMQGTMREAMDMRLSDMESRLQIAQAARHEADASRREIAAVAASLDELKSGINESATGLAARLSAQSGWAKELSEVVAAGSRSLAQISHKLDTHIAEGNRNDSALLRQDLANATERILRDMRVAAKALMTSQGSAQREGQDH